jgi:hypothetical protein
LVNGQNLLKKLILIKKKQEEYLFKMKKVKIYIFLAGKTGKSEMED